VFLDFFNGLVGVTVNGDLNLANDLAYISIEGGTTFITAHLKGGDSNLGFAPGSILTGTVLFEGVNTAVTMNGASGTLTIAPGAAIRSAPGLQGTGSIGRLFYFFDRRQMTLINQGTISSEVSGLLIDMSQVSSLNNQGTLQAINGGRLTLSNLQPNTGTISAGAGSLITINGVLTQTATGVIEIDIGGTTASQFGQLNVTGAATLAGTLNIVLVNGFTPTSGKTFLVMKYSSKTGIFDTVNNPLIVSFTVLYDLSDLTLKVV
jgi:hypothetical protein